ncbi:MAG: alanine/glycine:cation symporter family protein [Jeotgalicoccus sp.]|nr:alanine/glycine:cation symporter family protein [Jeotgalicoccus sp.]
METVVTFFNDIVWSAALVILLVVTGLYFSIRMRLFQVRYIVDMARLLFKGGKSQEGISSFQAIAVSLAGRVGTGNIVGVSTAIFIGGPGAVFWMWLIAFLGAGSAFVESTLAQIYKQKEDGQYRGGPAYYIEKGIGGTFGKYYALLFAVVTVLACGLLLPGIQANSISGAATNAFPALEGWMIGVFVVIILAVVIFGGIRSIANVATAVVPFMAIAYILVAVIIVIMNISEVPSLIALIFRSAFGLEQQFAGTVGAMIMIGVKRGLYSNEAGQGTGAHAAGAAEVSHPAKQGLVQAFSVYIDTLFVCTATALMILMTGMYNVSDGDGGLIIDNGVYQVNADGERDVSGTVAFTQAGIDNSFHGMENFQEGFIGFGSYFIAFALLFFCYTTMLAYYYIAETNLVYMLRGRMPWLKYVLGLALIASAFYGTVSTAGLAWQMGDLGVGLMAWINVIAILILQKPALRAFRDYERQYKLQKQGKVDEIVYTPEREEFKDHNFWVDEYPRRDEEGYSYPDRN